MRIVRGNVSDRPQADGRGRLLRVGSLHDDCSQICRRCARIGPARPGSLVDHEGCGVDALATARRLACRLGASVCGHQFLAGIWAPRVLAMASSSGKVPECHRVPGYRQSACCRGIDCGIRRDWSFDRRAPGRCLRYWWTSVVRDPDLARQEPVESALSGPASKATLLRRVIAPGSLRRGQQRCDHAGRLSTRHGQWQSFVKGS